MASTPGSNTKYGHLSKIDPSFAPLKEECDKMFDTLWNLPREQFIAAWLAPPNLPEDIPKDLSITRQMVPVRDGTEIEIQIYKSKTVKPHALMYFKVHGGGWCFGSHGSEEAENRYVAAKNDAIVVSVAYRLAPEFRYPYAINDSFDVLKWCKANAESLGIDPERIIVGGGSAGGNLAAVLALKARDEGVSGVIGQALMIPMICHPKLFPSDKYEFESFEQNKNASVINKARAEWFWEQYLPNAEPEAYASPLLASSLKDLPPALVQIAGLDPLRDEGFAYAEALKEAGVAVTLEVYPGLPHGFYQFPHLAGTTKYHQVVVDWVNEVSGKIK